MVLSFATGQRGDVVLVDDAGDEVYRWSDGMMFTQAVSELTVPAGEDVTLNLEGSLDVDPGDYVAEATVVAAPAPAPVRRDVTVTP